MLIRDSNGNIVNIKRCDFVTDSDYYKQLSLFYDVNLNTLQYNIHTVTKEKQYTTTDISTKVVSDKLVRDKISDYIRMM